MFLRTLRVSVVSLSSLFSVLRLAVRAGVLLLTPDALPNDPDGYWRLAANLVEHRTFGDGNAAHGLPSAAVSAGADAAAWHRAIIRGHPRCHRRCCTFSLASRPRCWC